MEAYFDNSATTKVLDCVKDAVVDAMCVNYGNAAAKHRKGVEAENLIREAKKAIADTLKVQEKEILFTSGGTESNNLALIVIVAPVLFFPIFIHLFFSASIRRNFCNSFSCCSSCLSFISNWFF